MVFFYFFFICSLVDLAMDKRRVRIFKNVSVVSLRSSTIFERSYWICISVNCVRLKRNACLKLCLLIQFSIRNLRLKWDRWVWWWWPFNVLRQIMGRLYRLLFLRIWSWIVLLWYAQVILSLTSVVDYYASHLSGFLVLYLLITERLCAGFLPSSINSRS